MAGATRSEEAKMAATCEIEDCGVQAIGRCERCGEPFCATHQVRPEGFGPRQAPPLNRCTACQGREQREYLKVREDAIGEYVEWRARGADPIEALLVGVRLLYSLARADDYLWRCDHSWLRVAGFEDDRSRLVAAIFPDLPAGEEAPTIRLAIGRDGLTIGREEHRELPWAPEGGSLWEAEAIGAWFVERARRAGLEPSGSFHAFVIRRRLLRADETSFAPPQPAWVFAGGSTAIATPSNPHADPSPYTAAVLADGSIRLHCHLRDGAAFDSGKSFPDSNLALRALMRMAEELELTDFALDAEALAGMDRGR